MLSAETIDPDRQVKGNVAPGFEPVIRSFSEALAEGGRGGAAFAVYRHGEPLVDIWGGVADEVTGRLWERDTLQLIFSGTKGLVAACLLVLIDRGQLELSAPVAQYWPEFGKPDILVEHVVSHRSRLAGIETPLTIADFTDDQYMASLLAHQMPCTDPRADNCYHALTYGWLCGELVKRISGQSIGGFFRTEIAVPLGLETWIGLPSELEAVVSQLTLANDWGSAPFLRPETWHKDRLIWSIWGNPPTFAEATFPWNSSAYRQAGIPGAGGISTARSMALFYDCLANGGGSILNPETVRSSRQPLRTGFDSVHNVNAANGIGFQLQTDLFLFGPPQDAFGHNGAGGSCHGAWPTEGLGFSFAMNHMLDDRSGDQRAKRLLEALHSLDIWSR